MPLQEKEISQYRSLGFSNHTANLPGMTAEKGVARGVKYAAQSKTREAKTVKIASAVLGKQV